MNPYTAPGSSAASHEELPNLPRTTLTSAASAACIVLFYAFFFLYVVNGGAKTETAMLGFGLGLVLAGVLGLVGAVMAVIDLRRNRRSRVVPALALLVNGAGFSVPFLLILDDFFPNIF